MNSINKQKAKTKTKFVSKANTITKNEKTKKILISQNRQEEYAVNRYNNIPIGLKLSNGDCSVEIESEPHLLIGQKIYERLFGLVYATHLEINAFGIIEKSKNGYQLTNIYMSEQVGSVADTEASSDQLSNLIMQVPPDELPKLKCHIHSHPDGIGVFWSTTDVTNINNILVDWLISIVVSKNMSIRCRMDINTRDIRIVIDDIPVYLDVNSEIRDEKYKKEIDEKVEAPVVNVINAFDTGDKFCSKCYEWHKEGSSCATNKALSTYCEICKRHYWGDDKCEHLKAENALEEATYNNKIEQIGEETLPIEEVIRETTGKEKTKQVYCSICQETYWEDGLCEHLIEEAIEEMKVTRKEELETQANSTDYYCSTCKDWHRVDELCPSSEMNTSERRTI